MTSQHRMRALILTLIIVFLPGHPVFSDDSHWREALAKGRQIMVDGSLWAAEQQAKVCVLEARRFGMTSFRVGQSLGLLAEVYSREGKVQEAKQSAQESLTILRRVFGASSKELICPLRMLAKSFADEGDFDASLKVCGDAIKIAQQSSPDQLPAALTTFMQVLAKMGKYDEAEMVKKRLFALTGRPSNSFDDLVKEAALESSLGAWPMAARTLRSAIGLAHKKRTTSSATRLSQALTLLANTYYLDGKYGQAIVAARRGVSLLEKATASQKCDLLEFLAVLGNASAKTGDIDTSLKSFSRLYNLAKTCKDKGAKAIANTLDVYRELLLKLGRSAEYLKISKEIPAEAVRELCTPKSQCPQHTLHFSENYSIGHIYIISSADERILGNACGRVHVDVATPLELHVINTDLAANTRSLSRIDPNEFWSLSFARSNISDNGMPCFSKLSGLHEIDLHSTNVTDRGTDIFTSMKSLYVINLGRTHITNATLSLLSKNLEPTSQLDLSNTDIDDKVGEELKQLTLLTGLSLAGTTVSDATVKQLAALKHLESLNLSRTRITDQSGQYIAQLASLKKLSLTDTDTSDSFLKALTKLHQLENLNLSRTQLTDDGLSYLTRLPSLKVLFLDGTKITPRSIPQLKRMTKLKDLSLFATESGLPGKIHNELPGCRVLGP
ncbi:MAG: hypothetical protein C5B53_12860 [Candidatus Melainabacteria bacterium]|nr:MAG: hypothetical protein C5B53_12860 [Candidatus Melainabacteria bacterium]